MKVGILTFHWATNYGAILQAYCLQEYLRELSCEVEIINYKPKLYDISWRTFLKHPSNWFRLGKFPIEKKKERLLELFRQDYLNLTQRYFSEKQLREMIPDYDLLISGSDQILNPFFTTQGEKVPTASYYLNFGKRHTMKIGYGVSFGCEVYPNYALSLAKQWINNFNMIGTREDSGLRILQQTEFKGRRLVVPDPTILLGDSFFSNLKINITQKEDYTCVYMLRHEIKFEGNVQYIDEIHTPISLFQWLITISHAKAMITNSYHGMIVAILSHVPFVAIAEQKKIGMNDRFNTLLKRLNLMDRITCDTNSVASIMCNPINWTEIDIRIKEYSKIGRDFLFEIINAYKKHEDTLVEQ